MRGTNWSADFLARKNSQQAIPIEIFDLYLGSQTEVDSETYFFNDSNYNFEFYPYRDNINKQNYTALGLERGPTEQTQSSAIDSLKLKLDNVSKTFSTLFTNYDLRGKRLVARQIYGDLLTNTGDYAIIFDGIIDQPEMSQQDISVEVRHHLTDSLDYTIPSEKFHIHCNNKFCGTECASGITVATLKDKKIGQTVDSIIGNVVFTDAARTEANNFYTPGIVEMTGGTASNIGEKRRVIKSTGDQIRIESPMAEDIIVGDEYSIERDCDKTELQCTGDFDNGTNFRGFQYLPFTLVVR